MILKKVINKRVYDKFLLHLKIKFGFLEHLGIKGVEPFDNRI